MTSPDDKPAPRKERLPVLLWVEEVSQNEVIWRHTANVSETGVFFDGATPREPGSLVQLRFELPTGRRIQTEARVVRSEWEQTRPGLAMTFVNMPPADLVELHAYLASQQR